MSSRGLGSFRKRLSARMNGAKEENGEGSKKNDRPQSPPKSPRGGGRFGRGRPNGARATDPVTEAPAPPLEPSPPERETPASQPEPQQGRGREASRPGMLQRMRERSRSRSRSRTRSQGSEAKEMLVAVTSCRSDGYYHQKAPGSTSKLPRKAPTNLKLFHELAVGVKDAYAAVGATPQKPDDSVQDGRRVLWDFVGNLDFVRVAGLFSAQR